MERQVKMHKLSTKNSLLIFLYSTAISHTCRRKIRYQDGMDRWRAQNQSTVPVFIGIFDHLWKEQRRHFLALLPHGSHGSYLKSGQKSHTHTHYLPVVI